MKRWLPSLFAVGLGAGCCLFSVPGYKGPPSDHFDGEQFHNQANIRPKGFRELAKWAANRKRGPWHKYRSYKPGPPPPRRVKKGHLRVTFIGHATTLIQIDGVNILTDPIWSRRASPVRWAGPERVRPPGIRFQDLPPIHAALVSHNHYDHMDVRTLRRLHEKHRLLVLAGLGNGQTLKSEGVGRARDLDWWQSVQLTPDVRVTFVPAQHFAQRSLCDRNITLWGGFVLEGTRHKVFFAGDTGFGPHFAQIRRKFGRMSLALLPIGAYKPRWFMKPIHLSPADAVKTHRILGARTSVAIHFGTFRLGDDGQVEAVRDLGQALKKAAIPASRFWVLGFGQGRVVP